MVILVELEVAVAVAVVEEVLQEVQVVQVVQDRKEVHLVPQALLEVVDHRDQEEHRERHLNLLPIHLEQRHHLILEVRLQP